MLEYDPKESSRYTGATTGARQISVQPSDPGEPSVGGLALSSVGHGGGHRTGLGPSATDNPIDAPSHISRSERSAGPSGLFGTLGRIFRRSRVAPLQTKLPDPPSPTPSQREGGGRGNRKRWFTCPWTSRLKNGSRTAESNRVPTRRHHVLRSSRVAPVDDKAAVPSRGQGMHRIAAVATDLATLDQNLEDSLAEKSPPMVLGRLMGSLFSCCTVRRGGLARRRSPTPRPPSQESEDQEQKVDETVVATSQSPAGEKVGCYPSVRLVTVAPATSPMFSVGSRGDSAQSNTSVRDGMGKAQPMERADTLQQQNHENLIKVAQEQTMAMAEEKSKTSLELLSRSQVKQQSNHVQEQSDGEDEYDGAPSIEKKDLRSICKKPHQPLILGRGQSGVVRLMRYLKPEGGSSMVALKWFVGSPAHSHATMAKEIRALRAVKHCPVFPKLIGVISDLSFAQEFIGNQESMRTLSIFNVLRHRTPSLSIENWALVLYDVITGLSALHQSGWAHCDLQCNNVLLWRDWSQPDESKERWYGRIIDLGNAKMLTGPTSQCLTLTPSEKAEYYRHCRHIAPEVVEGLVPYGVRSDVFGLGVLMTDIACRVPGMSDLIPLCNVCLAADPEQRPVLDSLLVELDVWCQDHTGQGFPQE